MDFVIPTASVPVANPVPGLHRRPAWPWLLLFVIVVAVAAGIWGYQTNWWRQPPKSWQAIFLSNGQVYFGHIMGETQKILVLRDIYYLQGEAPLQAGGSEKVAELSLVKLGNELHGPQDEMRINRDHILFAEALQDSSKVVKAIEQYRKNKE